MNINCLLEYKEICGWCSSNAVKHSEFNIREQICKSGFSTPRKGYANEIKETNALLNKYNSHPSQHKLKLSLIVTEQTIFKQKHGNDSYSVPYELREKYWKAFIYL